MNIKLSSYNKFCFTTFISELRMDIYKEKKIIN